jgi:hypothetical protein
MFGDLLEEGLLQVRRQELHDVRDEGLGVELVETPIGHQARAIRLQTVKKDAGVRRRGRQDDRKSSQRLEVLLNESIGAAKFPFQELDNLSIPVCGLSAHGAQKALDIGDGPLETVGHSLRLIYNVV